MPPKKRAALARKMREKKEQKHACDSSDEDSSDEETFYDVREDIEDGDHVSLSDDEHPADTRPRGLVDYSSSDDEEDLEELKFDDEEKVQACLARLARFRCLEVVPGPTTRPTTYTGNSKRTATRRKAAQKEHDETFAKHPKLTQFFKSASQAPISAQADVPVDDIPAAADVLAANETSDSDDGDGEPAAAIRQADGRSWKPSPQELLGYIARLQEVEKALGKNAAVAAAANKRNKRWTDYEKLRLLSVSRFFTLILKGRSQMDASLEISDIIYNAGAYRAAAIRDWAKQYRTSGELSVYKQGRHPKRATLIDDEAVQAACQNYLRNLKPDERTEHGYCRWFSDVYYVQRFGVSRATPLSPKTARAWFEKLGWYMWSKKKGIYVDGHERADVVQYRATFLESIRKYQCRMKTYSGPNMEQVKEPVLQPGEKEIVVVVQDECIVHANDGRKRILVERGHEPIFKKGEGASKMISGFCCPCHGPMALSPELAAQHPEVARNADVETYSCNAFPDGHSFVSIDVGKKYGEDGYWTSAHLDVQLKKRAIAIFKLLHPNCEGLWLFDNSQNHQAMAEDGLRVTHLNLGDGGKNAPKLRAGWFMQVGLRVVQPMQNAEGVQLGVKSILQGRGLWPAAGLKLADARKLLAEQPDFKEQRGRLVECMIGAGQHILMFPKYHCEFNFIENLWGRMKVYLRRNCDYDFAALQRSIPLAVESVPVPVIRRYAQRCDRFMDAYRPMANGVQLTPAQAARAVKKFKSHRCIPRDAATLFPENWAEIISGSY